MCEANDTAATSTEQGKSTKQVRVKVYQNAPVRAVTVYENTILNERPYVTNFQCYELEVWSH